MVVTNSDELANKAKSLKNMCYGVTNKFIHDGIGYNYRMPNVSAALGLGQFNQIDKIIKEKDRIFKRYSSKLSNVQGLNIPQIESYTNRYIMWAFNIYLDDTFKVSRDELVKLLKNIGIDTRDSFVPINQQKILHKKYNIKDEDCPNANYIRETGLYLPSGNNLTNQEIDYISDEIIKINNS